MTTNQATETHEFVPPSRPAEYYHGQMCVRYENGRFCGQPRDAAIHRAAPDYIVTIAPDGVSVRDAEHRAGEPAERVEYVTTKEQCERNIKGVCEGCGGSLTAIETVDNSGHPTFWQGCEHCSCFRSGVERKYFEVARKLVEGRELVPYSHMDRLEYEKTPERLDYFFDSQTAGLSHLIRRIHTLLKTSDTHPTPSGTEAERCPKCGHMPHGTVCFNMASDNDCDCKGDTPATVEAAGAPERIRAILDTVTGELSYPGPRVLATERHKVVEYIEKSVADAELSKLREALRSSANQVHYNHTRRNSWLNQISFEECGVAACAAARDALREAEQLIRALASPPIAEGVAEERCTWTEDPAGTFSSTCNNGWWFEDGNTEDHGWSFCPFCGKKIASIIESELKG